MSVKSFILPLCVLALVRLAYTACSGEYVYLLTFDFNWSFDTDRGFPNQDPNLEPSFSRVVCASHSPNYTMWKPGEVLSKPMQILVSEDGTVNRLQQQLRIARRSRSVLESNTTTEKSSSLGEVRASLRVNSSHTLLSCASRIDPSPAWFIGISSLDMCVNDTFLEAQDLVIFGWWGGLDESEEYLIKKPIEQGQTPFKVRRRIDVAPFGYGTLFITRHDPDKPLPTSADEDASVNAARTSAPQILPATEAICVDANSLRHLPSEALLFPTHRHAYVVCDPFNSCATPGHIVVYEGQPMMMKSYCELASGCERRLMLVNSPKYSRAMRIDTATHNLKFTAFAARFSTRTEESVLSLAVRMGL